LQCDNMYFSFGVHLNNQLCTFLIHHLGDQTIENFRVIFPLIPHSSFACRQMLLQANLVPDNLSACVATNPWSSQ
jgi:hypothetical protein